MYFRSGTGIVLKSNLYGYGSKKQSLEEASFQNFHEGEPRAQYPQLQLILGWRR